MTNIQNNSLVSSSEEAKQVYEIFLETKHEMEAAKDGMDKYYHAKANCTAAELGTIQQYLAILYSIGKEIYDFKKKILDLHMNIKDVAKDCYQDLRADWYGIQKAKEHGYCPDKVRDVDDYVFKKKY